MNCAARRGRASGALARSVPRIGVDVVLGTELDVEKERTTNAAFCAAQGSNTVAVVRAGLPKLKIRGAEPINAGVISFAREGDVGAICASGAAGRAELCHSITVVTRIQTEIVASFALVRDLCTALVALNLREQVRAIAAVGTLPGLVAGISKGSDGCAYLASCKTAIQSLVAAAGYAGLTDLPWCILWRAVALGTADEVTASTTPPRTAFFVQEATFANLTRAEDHRIAGGMLGN